MIRIRSEDIEGRVRKAGPEEQERLRQDVKVLARPRLAGSEGAAEVDADLRSRFESLGYRIRELPFDYSAWPGRFGFPLSGGLLLLGIVLGAVFLLSGDPFVSAICLLTALLLSSLVGALSYGAIRWLPFGRARGVNWLVQREGTTPRFLLVAHRDTKSQAVSTFLRVGSIIAALAATLILFLLALLAVVAPDVLWTPLIVIVAVVGAIGAALLMLCWAGNASPGALDNASGLAALLGLARRCREHDDVAFLVTDAEELGLIGARAVVGHLPPIVGLVNFDGLDDHGPFHLIERHGWPRAKGVAPHLAATLLAVAEALELPIDRRNLPIGLLVDHIAFVRAGLPAVTLMRGTSRSLQRVHRPSDTADRLGIDGVAAAVALVDGALALLRLPTPPRERILPDSLVAPRRRD